MWIRHAMLCQRVCDLAAGTWKWGSPEVSTIRLSDQHLVLYLSHTPGASRERLVMGM